MARNRRTPTCAVICSWPSRPCCWYEPLRTPGRGGVSSPRLATIDGAIGPTLDPLELAGRKLLALFDRAAPRDFADVYRLTNRFGRDAVVDMAREIDPGFDVAYLAHALDRANSIRNDDVPIEAVEMEALRRWATAWGRSI